MAEGPLGGPRPAVNSKPAIAFDKVGAEITDKFDLTEDMVDKGVFSTSDRDAAEVVRVRSTISDIGTQVGNRKTKLVVIFNQSVPGKQFNKVLEYALKESSNVEVRSV